MKEANAQLREDIREANEDVRNRERDERELQLQVWRQQEVLCERQRDHYRSMIRLQQAVTALEALKRNMESSRPDVEALLSPGRVIYGIAVRSLREGDPVFEGDFIPKGSPPADSTL